VPQPDLIGINPVPVAALPRFQKKMNAGRQCAIRAIGGGPSFAIPAAFGVGGEAELGNDAVRVGHTLCLVPPEDASGGGIFAKMKSAAQD